MWVLRLAMLAVVIYGSLYPFDFAWETLSPARFEWRILPAGLPDRAANVLLFLPYGAACLVLRRGQLAMLETAALLLLGFAVAVLLQYLQIWLPSRTPSLDDILMNGVGLVAGLAGAVMAVALAGGRRGAPPVADGAALIVLLLFAAYQLAPFAITLDVGLVWQNVKELRAVAERPVEPASLARNVLYGLTFVAAFRMALGPARPPALTIALAPIVWFGLMAARLLIIGNGVGPAQVLGSGIGVVLGLVLLATPRLALGLVALGFAGLIAQSGLTPAVPRDVPVALSLSPLSGFLNSEIGRAIQSFAFKGFAYGALGWALLRAGVPLAVAGVAVAAGLGGIELFQTRFAAGTPEITDPLLGVLLLAVLAAQPTAAAQLPRRLPGPRWRQMRVARP